MDRHGSSNTGSMWVLYFQPHRFKGTQLDHFHIETSMIRGIGQMMFVGVMLSISYIRCFLLVVEASSGFRRSFLPYFWIRKILVPILDHKYKVLWKEFKSVQHTYWCSIYNVYLFVLLFSIGTYKSLYYVVRSKNFYYDLNWKCSYDTYKYIYQF